MNFSHPQESLKKSTAVFTGIVTNIEIPGGKTVSSADPMVVTFDVSEIWKGVDKQELVLRTASQGSMCGYHFEQGEEYIVYAYSYKDNLWTGICERTKLISNAREDLQALGKGNIPTNSGSNINVGFARKTAQIPFNDLESRYVWAEDAGMNMAFNLTPLNFDGFYYDLDNNAGSERLNIKIGNLTDRSIKENDCIYSTTVVDVPFKYRPFGNYSIIGFMGERYFAGYTSGSRIASLPVTLVNRSLFGKILIDENKAHTLTNESNLPLKEKYVLKIKVLNITEGTIQVILEKFAGEMDRRIIKTGDTYVFEKDIGEIVSDYSYIYNKPATVGKIPIIAVHIDSVFGGEDHETGVIVRGIFQLSDVYTSVDPGFGLMTITNISETNITMTNAVPMTMNHRDLETISNWHSFEFGGYYDIMGDIKLKVADSEALRFSLYKESIETRNLEHRGAVYTGLTPVTEWDGRNFAGFWYNLDSDSSFESLEITDLTGRIIPAGGLKYTATAIEIPFISPKITGVKPKQLNGSYKAFGLGTKKYIVINETNILNLASILMDQGTSNYNKKSLMEGLHWEMGEGYDIAVRSINTQSREICLVLSKNSSILDEKCLLQGYVYSYPALKSSGESDIPIFFTYLDALFTGDEDDVIFLKYTWLRSNNVTEIHDEDSLGIFKVTKIGDDHIEMENEQDINLIPGSRINLIGDLGFVVANSNILRFYPSDRISADVVPETTTELTVELTTEMGSILHAPLVPVNSSMNPSDKNNKTSAVSFVAAVMSLILMTFFDRFTVKAKRRLKIE